MPPQNDGLGVRFGKRRDHPQVLDGLAVAIPAGRMQTGSLDVWAQIEGAGGVLWRIGHPMAAWFLANNSHQGLRHGALHPAMKRHLLAEVLPHALPFDPTCPGGYTFAGINGRRPEDGVDSIIRTVVAGEPRSGQATCSYQTANQFPYITVVTAT